MCEQGKDDCLKLLKSDYEIAQEHGKTLDNINFILSSGIVLFIANLIFLNKDYEVWLKIVLLAAGGFAFTSLITQYFSYHNSIIKNNKNHKPRSVIDTSSAIFVFLAMFILYVSAFINVIK